MTPPEAAKPVDLEELERAAKAATPGPWHREMIELGHGGPMTLGVGSPTDPICIVNGIVESPLGNRNVRYLVAFNPSVALSLIAELRTLREAQRCPKVEPLDLEMLEQCAKLIRDLSEFGMSNMRASRLRLLADWATVYESESVYRRSRDAPKGEP